MQFTKIAPVTVSQCKKCFRLHHCLHRLNFIWNSYSPQMKLAHNKFLSRFRKTFTRCWINRKKNVPEHNQFVNLLQHPAPLMVDIWYCQSTPMMPASEVHASCRHPNSPDHGNLKFQLYQCDEPQLFRTLQSFLPRDAP